MNDNIVSRISDANIHEMIRVFLFGLEGWSDQVICKRDHDDDLSRTYCIWCDLIGYRFEFIKKIKDLEAYKDDKYVKNLVDALEELWLEIRNEEWKDFRFKDYFK